MNVSRIKSLYYITVNTGIITLWRKTTMNYTHTYNVASQWMNKETMTPEQHCESSYILVTIVTAADQIMNTPFYAFDMLQPQTFAAQKDRTNRIMDHLYQTCGFAIFKTRIHDFIEAGNTYNARYYWFILTTLPSYARLSASSYLCLSDPIRYQMLSLACGPWKWCAAWCM